LSTQATNAEMNDLLVHGICWGRCILALHRSSSNNVVLYCIVLYCIVLHCIALYCIALHCIALHCIALHCIALHCIALHCILHCKWVTVWRCTIVMRWDVAVGCCCLLMVTAIGVTSQCELSSHWEGSSYHCSPQILNFQGTLLNALKSLPEQPGMLLDPNRWGTPIGIFWGGEVLNETWPQNCFASIYWSF